MDALQWMGAVRIKNITIIHSTPSVNIWRRNKSSIKTFIIRVIIHNNSSSVRKCSGLNQERNLHRSKLIWDWILTWETTAEALFHWGRVIMDYDSYYRRLNAGFVSSPDDNWWTGVLWCFYSDGTHSLQSIHRWDTFFQTWRRNTHLYLEHIFIWAELFL